MTKGIPSERQLRVGELIKRNLGNMFSEGLFSSAKFNLITFTEARVNANLQVAIVFFDSIFDKAEVLAELNKHKIAIRRELASRLNLKFAPEVSFKIDESIENAAKIEEILKSDEVKKDLDSKD